MTVLLSQADAEKDLPHEGCSSQDTDLESDGYVASLNSICCI